MELPGGYLCLKCGYIAYMEDAKAHPIEKCPECGSKDLSFNVG
jgi:DNA-directed RNA polymerase subunit RPC12/RpoP